MEASEFCFRYFLKKKKRKKNKIDTQPSISSTKFNKLLYEYTNKFSNNFVLLDINYDILLLVLEKYDAGTNEKK